MKEGNKFLFKVMVSLTLKIMLWRDSVFRLPGTESRRNLQSKSFLVIFINIPADRYAANERFVVDNYSVSQHSRKPLLAVILVFS